MGHVASGRIRRAALAEDLLAVPCFDVRTECAAAIDCQVQHTASMVSACGFRSRCAQVPEVRRVPCGSNHESGYCGRLTARNPNLREMSPSWRGIGGITLFRVPQLPRLDEREIGQRKFHVSSHEPRRLAKLPAEIAAGNQTTTLRHYFVFITYTPSHTPFGAFSENSIARSRNTFDGPSSGKSARMSTNFAAASLQF